MSLSSFALLIAAGFIAGFINTLAGSGSVITLPALIFLGLPATVANGTNRVAVLLQNISALASFRRDRVLDARGALWLAIPAALGSFIGAHISLGLNETLMRQVLGVVMLVMLVLILLQPERWLHGTLQQMKGRPRWQHMLLLFAIGMYGGFIQVGVGVFLLVALVLGLGYDVVRANAVKVAVVLGLTAVALGVFATNARVVWREGIVLAIGSTAGAWIGARFAVQRGAVWVRRLLIAIIVFSAAQLLGVLDWLGRLL